METRMTRFATLALTVVMFMVAVMLTGTVAQAEFTYPDTFPTPHANCNSAINSAKTAHYLAVAENDKAGLESEDAMNEIDRLGYAVDALNLEFNRTDYDYSYNNLLDLHMDVSPDHIVPGGTLFSEGDSKAVEGADEANNADYVTAASRYNDANGKYVNSRASYTSAYSDYRNIKNSAASNANAAEQLLADLREQAEE